MMKRFVVSFGKTFVSNITDYSLEFVEAETWRGAIGAHSIAGHMLAQLTLDPEWRGLFEGVHTLDEYKEACLEFDFFIDVKEIS